MLVQAGGAMGDKSFNGCLPNMKRGEYRYYPQDNHNINQNDMREISKKVFQRILKYNFPEYLVDPDPDDGEIVGSIGKNEILSSGELYYIPLVINKGYICFRESTLEREGLTMYLHNGYILVYREKYTAPLKKIHDSPISPEELSEKFERITYEGLCSRPYKIEDEDKNQAILVDSYLFQKLIDCALSKDNKDILFYKEVRALNE